MLLQLQEYHLLRNNQPMLSVNQNLELLLDYKMGNSLSQLSVLPCCLRLLLLLENGEQLVGVAKVF